ncbi:hypothetical protein H5410_022076 [Solanum commersonii]|uniref:Dehydrogenase/reductase SDR family member 7 n=1 Tax=Solanum commersonii TaxID=4109 RepID=A0A9J5ZCW0_SOLCO|nr:hypothetical protein H5410_022076 [Solanum commersonii]
MMILYLVFLVIFAFLFIKFLTADGDFTLLSKGKVKREEIEDKVIWITGASRGIGEILAKQLASLGAKLIISARNEAELQHVKQQLTGKYAPRDVMVLPLDLTSGEESLRLAVEKAESFFDAAGVDYMIHNAAYERPNFNIWVFTEFFFDQLKMIVNKSTALDVTEETLKEAETVIYVTLWVDFSNLEHLSMHEVSNGQCQKALWSLWWTMPKTSFYVVEMERNSRYIGGMGNQIPKIKMNSLLLFHFWCKEEPLLETVAILEILDLGEAGVLPITYLGMPSGVKSKSVEIWDGVIENCEKRLTRWKSQYLSLGARLTLINFERRGYQLVKWKTVITEKRVGGLGIKNMKNQSKALRMKWLWKYSNDNQNMCGSVIKENYEESDSWMTKEIKVVDGIKTRFWKDDWHEEENMETLFPNIHNLVLQQQSTIADLCIPQGWNFGGTDCSGLGSSKGIFKLGAAYKKLNHQNLQLLKWPWRHMESQNPLQEAVLTQENLMKRRITLCSRCWKAKIPYKVSCFVWLLAKEAFIQCEVSGQLWNLFLRLKNMSWSMPGRFQRLYIAGKKKGHKQKTEVTGELSLPLFGGQYGKRGTLEFLRIGRVAMLNVNVVGPISMTRMLVPYMLKRGRGHLVVMSSAAGKTPAPGQAVYSASKFAVNGYFHSLRSEKKKKKKFRIKYLIVQKKKKFRIFVVLK